MIRPGAGAKSRVGSSALIRTSIGVPAAGGPAGALERRSRGDAQLLADEIDPRHHLRHGMLDLKPGIQLDEVERPVGAEQELEGAGVPVADRAARALRSGFHRLPRLVVECRRGRFLDQLLVAPLDRALALAEREHAALAIGEHLDLDVPRR